MDTNALPLNQAANNPTVPHYKGVSIERVCVWLCVCDQTMLRTHDSELDQLMRQNRQSQEKLSAAQVAECKALQKKLKSEQVNSASGNIHNKWMSVSLGL